MKSIFLSFILFHFYKADYTLDDSFWNEDSPAGKIKIKDFKFLFECDLILKIAQRSAIFLGRNQWKHAEGL